MAARASRLARKHGRSARRGRCIEAAGWGRRRNESELIEVKRWQLRRDSILVILDMPEPISRRDRELRSIVEAGVVEVSLAVHLEICDERIPVRCRAPTRPRLQ